MSDLEIRIEGYLDGVLSPQETLEFEKDLFDPDVAFEFRQALLLRELLRQAPLLDDVPEGLVEKIVDTLTLGGKNKKTISPPNRFQAVGVAIKGSAWIFKGPALAMGGMSEGIRNGQKGFAYFRYVLGPRATKQDAPRKASPSFFRRLIGWGQEQP